MYQVFSTNAPDQTLLNAPISALWRLGVLEVVVQEDNGSEPALLLEFAGYPLAVEGEHPIPRREGFWCCPYAASPIPIGFSPPSTLGSLRKLVAKDAKKFSMRHEMEHVAYLLGLQDAEVSQTGSFLEVKNSPRSPGVIKAYFIERYSVKRIDPLCLGNIADPEGLLAHRFLPLDAFDALPRINSEGHGRSHKYFCGKPLMSNVEHVLSDNDSRAQLRSSAMELPERIYSHRENGLLLMADLAGYGRALQYARRNMRSFGVDAQQIQRIFRVGIARQFERIFAHSGTTQVQPAGDGFLAAFPVRVDVSMDMVLQDVLSLWRGVIDFTQQMNASIEDPTVRVGSRLAIHYGSYEYGRVCGTASTAIAFDGESIVEVARMEQGLAVAMREGRLPGGSELYTAKDGSRHVVSLSQTVPVAPDVLVAAGYPMGGPTLVGAKESELDVVAFGCACE